MRPLLSLALAAIACPALAQGWEPFRLANTADLAASGWRQVGAASVSGWYPNNANDAGDALVTFWEGELGGARIVLRCITRYFPAIAVTLDECERPAGDPQWQDLFRGFPEP